MSFDWPGMERVERVPALPVRERAAHKGTFGRVLILGGSRGMAGAPALAGRGALRAGAGLVRVGTPEGIRDVVAGFEPSYMTIGLPESRGSLAVTGDEPEFLESLAWADVVAVGPGLGSSTRIDELVAFLVRESGKRLVVDADALNTLTESVFRENLGRDVVFTPHPGEMARLLGKTTAEIQSDRPRAVHAVAAGFPGGQTLALKGAGTLVADGSRYYINDTGNPGMATGGSGDVLTGVIAALMAQGLGGFDAACLGVRAHGLAGDRAALEFGEIGLIASDLPNYLGKALSFPEEVSNNRTVKLE